MPPLACMGDSRHRPTIYPSNSTQSVAIKVSSGSVKFEAIPKQCQNGTNLLRHVLLNANDVAGEQRESVVYKARNAVSEAMPKSILVYDTFGMKAMCWMP